MKRYHITDGGYRYDRLIFWGAIAMILLFLGLIGARHNFDFSTANVYIKCESDNGVHCRNPIYNITECKQQLRILFVIPLYTTKDCTETCTQDWCNWATLPPGEYGTPPDPLMDWIPFVAISLLVLAVLVNHFVHNRGKRPQIQLNLKKETREKIRKFFSNLEE